MEPALQAFEQARPDFAQFVSGYEFANADQETRHKFILWNKEEMLQAHERALLLENRDFEIARKLLKLNRPIEEIMEVTGLTRQQIEGSR